MSDPTDYYRSMPPLSVYTPSLEDARRAALFPAHSCDNKDGADQRVNAARLLTRSSDSTREGLAVKVTRPCSIAGCDRPMSCRTYCKSHYARWWRHGDAHALSARTESLRQKFDRLVPNRGDGCWEWTGLKDRKGYGIMRQKPLISAHRFAYGEFVEQIPPGMLIRHTCDNPSCVNPAHLLTGTVRDNTDDKVRRHRQSRGEAHYQAKLNEQTVRHIRAEYAKGGLTFDELGARVGVTRGTIHDVVVRKTWRHVRDAEC